MEQSTTEYTWIERAYNHFNRHLFKNRLPGVFFTYRRRSDALGIFAFNTFRKRGGKEEISEIGLNPDFFKGRSDIKILSDLAHEMCHVWQYYHGHPSRSGYHNREWADKMETIGLMPSDTGEPGGARTGQRMSDYIIEGHHMFEYQAKILIKRGFQLKWESIRREKRETSGSGQVKAKNKIKYTCRKCGLNVWGKSGLQLICRDCHKTLFFEGKEGITIEATKAYAIAKDAIIVLRVFSNNIEIANQNPDDDMRKIDLESDLESVIKRMSGFLQKLKSINKK